MKKTATVFLLLITAFCIGSAQTISQQQRPLVVMQTGTWCPYCGEYGRWIQEQLDSNYKDKAVIIEVHIDDFFSNTAYPVDTDFINNYNILTGGSNTPGWFVNDATAGGNGDSSEIYQKIKNKIDYAYNTPASVGVGYTSQFNSAAGTLQINAKVKFFNAASGDYYLNFYIIKDSMYSYQNGYGFTYLNNILAKAVYNQAPGYNFGQLVASGSITSGQEFSNYSVTFTDSILTTPNARLIGVIWKQGMDLGRHTYAPVNTVQQAGLTSVTGIDAPPAENDIQVNLTPNPVDDNTRLQLETTTSITDAAITILDMNGRQVMNLYNGDLKAGSNQLAMNAATLQSGVYFVRITAQGQQLTKKLVVAK